MNLGEQLIINRAKHKESVWANKLTGCAKEAHKFFNVILAEIKEDIKNGLIINSICMPSSLEYEKGMDNDMKFYEVVNNFNKALEKDGLRATIQKMPPSDLNRWGDYDHYVHINPIV